MDSAPSLGGPVAARKVVTALFCDVAGSTALGELLDAEVLQSVLSRYFALAAAVIERHGGTVEKFIGDAVMAVFGVPVLHEDDAVRACRAAQELMSALLRLNDELERDFGTRLALRIGVNSGEVAAVAGQLLATGDAVNVAARLEQAAEPGQILIGPVTLALARDAVTVEALEPLALKGKGRPLQAYRLIAVEPGRPRAAWHLDVPMVGRADEKEQLEEAFRDAVAAQTCRLVTVVGTAGVGKSRLTAEFLTGLDARVVTGRCLSYGEGITYWPVVEVVKQLGDVGERLTAEGPGVAAALGALMGEGTTATADEIAWAVRRLFEEAAAERPLVVVFDDIHWGEPTFLDLVERVADLSHDAPILILCVARPELLEQRPAWSGNSAGATVSLQPLGPGETGELIDRLSDPGELDPEFVSRIRAASAGNPLFVEEMVAMARDSEGEEVAVPPTIKALLAARIDQLDPAERGVLERGSVEGQLFHRAAVEALSTSPEPVLRQLLALVRKDLVRPDRPTLAAEDAYRFRHLLIRDAAYDALPKAARAILHERFANWLEVRGELVEHDEIVGYHLEQAYRYRTELAPLDDDTRALAERAGNRLAAAGFRASARGDLGAAANLLGRADALLPPQSRERIEVVLALVEPLVALMRVTEIETMLEQASTAAELLGDERLTARLKVEKAWLVIQPTNEQFSGSLVLSQVEEAMAVFERLGDDVALARALEVVTIVHLYFGRLAEVAAASERGLRHAERAQHVKLQGKHRFGRQASAQWGATPFARIDELLEEDIAWARQTASIGVEACSTVRLGAVRAARGDRVGGNELFARGMATCAELGTRIWAFQELGLWIWALTDDLDLAEAKLRESRDLLAEAGKRGMVSSIASILAECLYRQGRYDEASDVLAEAAELGAEDDVVTQVYVRAGRAKLAARRGKLDEAEALAREGAALSAETEFVDLRADSLLALAEVLRLGGRKEEAAAAVREALALWEAKGNAVYVGMARTRLAALLPANP